MLEQKDRIIADNYRSGSLSPNRLAMNHLDNSKADGSLPLMRRQQYAPEDITTAEVLTRVSQKD